MKTIYEVLRRDHENLRKHLNELVSMKKDSKRRQLLLERIRDGLVPHSRAEEAVFYNSLRSVPVVSDEIWHGYREHMEAETYLRTLQVASVFNAEFKAVAKKLKEAVEHHIEEEESEIFRLAEGVLTNAEARQMATAFNRMKAQVKKESFLRTTVDMVANLMPLRFSRSFRRGRKTLWASPGQRKAA